MQRPRHFVRRPAPHATSADTLRIADIWLELKTAVSTLPGLPDSELKRSLDRCGTLLCERCCALNPLARPHFEEEAVNFDDAVRSAIPIPRRRGSIAQSTVSRARTVDVSSARAMAARTDMSKIIVPQVIRKVVPKMAPLGARSVSGVLASGPQSASVQSVGAQSLGHQNSGVIGTASKTAGPASLGNDPRFYRARARVSASQSDGARGYIPRQRSAEVPEFSVLSGGHRAWPSAFTPAFPGKLMSMPAVHERCSIRTSCQSKMADTPLRMVGDKLFFVFDGLKDDADLEGSEPIYPRTPEASTSGRSLSRNISLPDDEDEDAWLVPPQLSADNSHKAMQTTINSAHVTSAARAHPQSQPQIEAARSVTAEAPRSSAAPLRNVPIAIRTASRVVIPSSPEVSPAREDHIQTQRSVSSKRSDAAHTNNKKRGLELQPRESLFELGISHPSRLPPEPASSRNFPQAPPISPPSVTVVPQDSPDVTPEVAPHSRKKKSSKKRKAPTEEPKSKKKKRKKAPESIYIASLCSPNRVPKSLTEALTAAEEAKRMPVPAESDLYEVEAIREMMIDQDEECEYFLVKWESYSESDNTWEPNENLEEFGHHKQRMELLRRIYHAKLMVSQNISRNPEYTMSFSVDEDPEFVRVMRSFNDQERTRRLDGSELFYVTASAWTKPSPF